MLRKTLLLASALLLFSAPQAGAREKEKHNPLVAADILRAETVFVAIHPDAGEPLVDITANRKAREAVERALMKWGRYRLVQEAIIADLVFTVRPGTGGTIRPTVKGGSADDRPVVFQPADGGDIRVGAQHGRPPGPSQPSDGRSGDSGPHLRTEAGPPDDMLEVYRGRAEQPALDSAPVWRYTAKDALREPTIAAVEQFKKALAEAEKAANQKPTPAKP